LKGEGRNTSGIGAMVYVFYNETMAFQEQMPMRGFESTVDSRLNFGLGNTNKIDSVLVIWPGGKETVITKVSPNQHIVVSQKDARQAVDRRLSTVDRLFAPLPDNNGLDFVHKENEFADFDRDKLIFHMISTQGPRMAKGDINADGLEDLYICGAKDQAGALYTQTSDGKFVKTNQDIFQIDSLSEDTDAIFFDCDGDKDQDLYVCSGGNEFSPNSTALINRLYINNGRGLFTKSPQVLPSYIFESTSCVSAGDYDGDSDLDLFVGVRLKPFSYGHPCKSYILQNNGKGVFSDVTQSVAPGLMKAGMVCDGQWFDYDNDGRLDLVIAGEYMPVMIYHNENGQLKQLTSTGLDKSNGWWNRIRIADLNADGYPDIVAANHGLNSRFRATEEKPLSMYVSDFDNNGTSEQIVTRYNEDSAYPVLLRHDLVNVLPYLKKKYLKYEDYKDETINEIFSKQQLDHAIELEAYCMESSVIMNNKNGTFTRKRLPVEAQLSGMYGIEIADFDGDGNLDIVMGGNFYESKPETGIYDASYGIVLKGNGKGNFTTLPLQQSGLMIKGAVRDFLMFDTKNEKILLAAINNAPIKLFKVENGKTK
jgi:hypothetical protein